MPDANSAIEHFSNSVEYVLFTEGWISLRVGEQEYFLETEDALCNNASLSHCYINNCNRIHPECGFLICFLYSEQ